MIRIFILIAICLVANFANALDDTQKFIADASLHKKSQLQAYNKFAVEAKQNSSKVTSSYKQDAVRANLAAQKFNFFKKNNKNIYNFSASHPEVIIFVSFSMPDASIVAYIRDAKKIHASVVIRGLINNSFKDTVTKMSALINKVNQVNQSGVGGVELNPPLFKRFAVHDVPAVVVFPANTSLSSNKNYSSVTDFDVVYGDIPLFNALKIIRDHGVVANHKADELVAVLQDSFHE